VDGRAIFEAWAPADAPWTPWAKPILFAHVDSVRDERLELVRPAWLRREFLSPPGEAATYRSASNGATAVVVDLAGIEGIALGLTLADFGFRPVPLYNALPALRSIVPMDDVLRGIVAGAEQLARRPPSRHAPPAFLLDARRAGPGGVASPGQFDNRSVAFGTDFPSAVRLQQAAIVDVILVQSGRHTPASDLAVTLAKWHAAGIALRLLRADSPAMPAPMTVPSVGFLGRFQQWLRRSSLRGDTYRGFGGAVPHGG
jgi:hypothetical protein